MSDQGTVLILGADGFIGRHIAFGLRAAGWRVIAHARRTERLSHMGFETLALDLTAAKAADPDFWRTRLSRVTHLVNAAGLLTGTHRAFQAVHSAAPNAIYASLPSGAQAVLISAVGIGAAQTPFAHYRRKGEDIAKRYDVTILRPGLVLGDTSYGGSSLLRALAAMPLCTPVVGKGEQAFNPIHASDLAVIVAQLLIYPHPDKPLEIGGPETLSQTQVIQKTRAWLGLRPVPALHLPLPLAHALGWIGDRMRLGPISRSAVAQLNTSVLAKPAPELANFPAPRGLSAFLNARPASSQDLWHARLYLTRPLLRITLAFLWLASGILGLTLAPGSFLPLLPNSPLPDSALLLLARMGGLIDLAIAASLLRGWRPKRLALIQALMVAGYTAVFSILAPLLWLLPLGGLLKNIPILALIGVSAILEDER